MPTSAVHGRAHLRLQLRKLALRDGQSMLEGRMALTEPASVPLRAATARVLWTRGGAAAVERLGLVRIPPPKRGGSASVRLLIHLPAAAPPGRHVVFICVTILDGARRRRRMLGCIRAGIVRLHAGVRAGGAQAAISGASAPPSAQERLPAPYAAGAFAARPSEPFAAESFEAPGGAATAAGPPEPIITAAPHGIVVEGPATLEFRSEQAGDMLECSLDEGAFAPCSSPFVTPPLRAGRHSFSVRAVSPTGAGGQPPARAQWVDIPRRVDLCGRIERSEVLGPADAGEYVIEHCQATISRGAQVTLEPGCIIRALAGGLEVEGVLIAAGSASQPVLLSSLLEVESAEGSAPSSGDWQGIELAPGASADLHAVTIKYAAKALAVAAGDAVTIDGSILDSTVGISAETWVDATGVEWGSTSGPAPAGSGPAIEGDGPMVVPWVGWTPARRPALVPEPEPAQACGASSEGILFVGARGSGEPPQAVEGSGAAGEEGLGGPVAAALRGFRSRMSQLGSADAVSALGLRYPALALPEGVPVDELISGAYGELEGSYWQGAANLAGLIQEVSARCPHLQIVLAGYSQGALAIHLALTELLDSAELSDIAAVILIADPAHRSADPSVLREGGAASAGEGIYAQAFADTSEAVHSLPTSLAGHAIELCHEGDIICAPGVGADLARHEEYSEAEADAVGAWAAEHLTRTSG
ncbi:MAG TPA: cutinase family protein [Solirubrobacteraceae bacterium]|nr:cutinase family protein [Solirubrobacteraceae bacterium]